jgi:hypothetical protein
MGGEIDIASSLELSDNEYEWMCIIKKDRYSLCQVNLRAAVGTVLNFSRCEGWQSSLTKGNAAACHFVSATEAESVGRARNRRQCDVIMKQKYSASL